ncbi:WG repeat-containing protein [bacterium SCSIO 12741]|nr:WG repeat-containing protein [bacterium SCSIO 12741]
MKTFYTLCLLLATTGLFAQKNLYVAKSGKQYGYINEHCEWVVKPEYDRVFKMDGNVGVVMKSDRHGLINRSGELVLAVEHDYLKAGGGMVMFRKNEKFGYYSPEGEEMIAAKYVKAKPFKEDRAMVLKGTEWIYVDKEGNEYSVGSNMKLHNFSEGYGLVLDKTKGKFGYVNDQGEWTIEAQYDKAKDFHEGFARVLVGDKWGYIRQNGEWLVEPKYGNTFDFQEKHARVLTDNGYTFLKADGTELNLGKVDKVHDFTEGVARVIVGKKVGLIDGDGNWLAEPQFESVKPMVRGYIPAAQKGKWGFINSKGEWIIQPAYAHVAYPSQGMVPVMFKKLWGFVDESGNIVIEPAYDNLFELPPMGIASYNVLKQPLYQNGIARAKSKKQWNLIDTQGQQVCSEPLDYIGVTMIED